MLKMIIFFYKLKLSHLNYCKLNKSKNNPFLISSIENFNWIVLNALITFTNSIMPTFCINLDIAFDSDIRAIKFN